jgi:hypothetical protein
VVTISADEARTDFGGGTAFAFETQDWWRSGRAQNLIGLIFERNSVTVSPDAPQLKSFSIATPKPEEIELRLVAEKIDRDRFG